MEGKAMFTRKLGSSGIQVSAMGLGCWAIGGPFWRDDRAVGWGQIDDGESIRALRRALDLGVTFFDTADVYGCGHSEHVLGQALAGVRDRVVIATKFGSTFDEGTRQAIGQDASPGYVRQACEASLRRLNTDHIDLYQFHLGGCDPVAAVAVRDVLEELVAAGKIRCYGWSTDDPDRARVFAEGAHCAAIQQQLNVFGGEEQILALCEEFDLASINRGPLAMGLLTGKFRADSRLPADDVRGPNSPSWMRFFKDGKPNPEFLGKLEAVRDILTSGGRTLAQGALAWIWGRSDRTIPIPGFKTMAQIEENVAAMDLGPLAREQVEEIDTLLGR
jgi:aryl-alcohol dehydrogenase-like predicted oxidoreductase